MAAQSGADATSPAPDNVTSSARFAQSVSRPARAGAGFPRSLTATACAEATHRHSSSNDRHIRSAPKYSRARAKAPCPSLARRTGSWHSRRRAAASASASPGGTTSPDSPSRLTQGTPVGRSVLTTGRPHSIASTCTMPKASWRVTDGSTNTSARLYQSSRSASLTRPRKRTRSCTPSSRANASRLSRSGPSPTSTSDAGTPTKARSSTSTPLYGTSLPTNSSVGCAGRSVDGDAPGP